MGRVHAQQKSVDLRLGQIAASGLACWRHPNMSIPATIVKI
jgi:hypothetical protein